MKHDTQNQQNTDGMPGDSGMEPEFLQKLRARCLAEGLRCAQTLERERVGRLLGGMMLSLACFEMAEDEGYLRVTASDMASFVRALLAEADLRAECLGEASGKEGDHE